jgi:hypothetical protein
MSVLIFKLNGVSEEEAEDVRQLLEEHRCDYYESSAGRWGISVAGLWLQDKSQKDYARELIDTYQQQRVQRLQGQNEPAPSLWHRFRVAPAQMVAMFILIVIIMYVSIAPFMGLL